MDLSGRRGGRGGRKGGGREGGKAAYIDAVHGLGNLRYVVATNQLHAKGKVVPGRLNLNTGWGI